MKEEIIFGIIGGTLVLFGEVVGVMYLNPIYSHEQKISVTEEHCVAALKQCNDVNAMRER